MRFSSDLPLVLSSIPSPGTWGRQYRLYGIMIALGVIFGLELARRRWAARGANPEDMSSIALWAVPAGLFGARLYHVITDNELYRGHWFDNPWAAGANSPLAIWQGGLGIPGGILVGVGAGAYVARRKGIRLGPALDTVAPALALAQAIGRWGNYFNVELYGGPTTLPWGLDVPIGTVGRPPEPATTLFHPTFLYESLWNVGLVLLLIWIDRQRAVRPGRIFALYIGGYFLGRLWVEALRVDFANTILGLRVNTWLSLLAIAGVLAFFLIAGIKRRAGDSDEPYRDGHRWDPESGIVAPLRPGSDNPDLEPRDQGESIDFPGAVPATGTRARAARRDAKTVAAGAAAALVTDAFTDDDAARADEQSDGGDAAPTDQRASGGGEAKLEP